MSRVRDAAAGAARVAVIERHGKFLVAEPFFGRGPRLVVSRDSRYRDGDLVVVRPGAGGRRGGSGRARVLRRIGRPGVARDVIEALLVDRGLRRGFDPAVCRDAAASASRSWGLDGGRRDLRSMPTFTIDPASARDFDDAVSAAVSGDGSWTVWVHIADVSFYVPPRSLVDREAYRRGTSVYAPGAVEPMLPAALSNEACSLVPLQDRLAVTVEMEVAQSGVARSSFYRSVIRSDARLSYDQVDRVFEGLDRAPEPWAGALAAARAAAGALAALRASRGALVVESTEPEVAFDDSGAVKSIEPVAQTESHRLIEHLMIAANEAVAGILEARKVPALYRVHERPEASAVLRLVDQLASLGVPTPPVPRGALTPQQAASLVGEVSVSVASWVARTGRGGRALNMLVLRTLKQAYYDHRNLGHAGLQSPRYCHFTSPIRRYPDLICHRALLSAIDGSVAAPDAASVAAAGPWTSEREREAMVIERDADDVARCFLLQRVVGSAGVFEGSAGVLEGSAGVLQGSAGVFEGSAGVFEGSAGVFEGSAGVFEGEVVGLIGAGAFIAFGPQLSFQGLLPVRRMRGDWWELNEQETMLVGTRSGSALRLGDPVSVRVGTIDAPRGRVDLLPVDD